MKKTETETRKVKKILGIPCIVLAAAALIYTLITKDYLPGSIVTWAAIGASVIILAH